jgi:hypothetical protein
VDDGGWENSVSGKVRGQSWSKHLFRQLGLTNTLLVQSVRTDAAVVLMARRTSCKLLKNLVAAVGLEPTTYGL